MDIDDRYRAPALDKGLDILELLATVDGGLTQAEISKHLDRNPNSFYRMLDRLVKRGYVTKLDGDRYSLTLKLFGLGQLHAPVRRLASFAMPYMRDLAQASKQANQLAVFDRGSVVVIAQQEAPDYWGISIRVGSHISMFDTGSGHILLAFSSPEEREMMIAAHIRNDEKVQLGQGFYERLDQIRERGYEMMPSAQMAGVYNLSAPILGSDGTCIAALTCPYVTLVNSSSGPDITQTINLLQKTVKDLSKLVGADIAATE
ncbi:IclR family transcriptional regulator [Pseudochrobactrum kiredjianiae]|uniref:IclR family transcriptional regulator n=1 Tax=Pseudochrobactrum kiredjianiae TaxID=386305 RepID=A0ABW3V653_9HYPH|nr:IclR family transcriptional regulator [Pseudochrobactrum kiredjianiae]MDM7850632.1 IclR family transcriptional regulator [Pseudochrobactrum kiredjianiae]